VERFKPCPYCGVLFSGKYGPDKRAEIRTKKEIPSVFTYRGQNIQACTMDVSHNGVCLKVFGSSSLPVGETVNLSINDVSVRAQIMWFANSAEVASALTGLKILDGSVSAY
jgi:hypothetical protein